MDDVVDLPAVVRTYLQRQFHSPEDLATRTPLTMREARVLLESSGPVYPVALARALDIAGIDPATIRMYSSRPQLCRTNQRSVSRAPRSDRWELELAKVVEGTGFSFEVRRTALGSMAVTSDAFTAQEWFRGVQESTFRAQADACNRFLEDSNIDPILRIDAARAAFARPEQFRDAIERTVLAVVQNDEILLATRVEKVVDLLSCYVTDQYSAWPVYDWFEPSDEMREECRRFLFQILDPSVDLETEAKLQAAHALRGPTRVVWAARVAREDQTSHLAKYRLDDLKAIVADYGEDEATHALAMQAWMSIRSERALSGRGHVFISYVHDDKRAVERLAADLELFGLDVWLDAERMRPGLRWQDQLRSAISNGGAFVAVFSDASESREQTYMREELILAVTELRRRPRDQAWFFPVLLSDVPLPSHQIGPGETLSDLQYVSLATDWDGGVAQLSKSILEPKGLWFGS